MLHLLRLLVVAVVGTWGLVRACEEFLGVWVRRASRPRTDAAWA